MTQITPYALWIGHAGEGRDFTRIFDLGIHAIIDLALEEKPTQPPRELIYQRVPLIDGCGNRASLLFLAISTLATLLKMHVPTLVVCSAGLSRSPAIAAAALSLLTQDAPADCLQRVVAGRGGDLSPGFWKEVVDVLAAGPSSAAKDVRDQQSDIP